MGACHSHETIDHLCQLYGSRLQISPDSHGLNLVSIGEEDLVEHDHAHHPILDRRSFQSLLDSFPCLADHCQKSRVVGLQACSIDSLVDASPCRPSDRHAEMDVCLVLDDWGKVHQACSEGYEYPVHLSSMLKFLLLPGAAVC